MPGVCGTRGPRLPPGFDVAPQVLARYAECLCDHQFITNQHIEHLLRAYDPPPAEAE